jgi:hypothetical protein
LIGDNNNRRAVKNTDQTKAFRKSNVIDCAPIFILVAKKFIAPKILPAPET